MKNMFNPFKKRFDSVNEEDLEILETTAEGWHIEYKRETPSAKVIAKSISSFANSYGGILFIGIESDSKSNFGINFIGVNDKPDLIRDSVRGNLDPFPYFDTYTIELKNGKHIIMIAIQEGEDPPYVHSDGKIYRRQSSASDPIAENNRYSIDELYRKSQKYQEEIENFRIMDYTFTQNESDNSPFLEIYANTIPFNHFVLYEEFNEQTLGIILDAFNKEYSIQEEIEGKTLSLNLKASFDTVNTYRDSVALRYLKENDLAYNGLTIEIDYFGNMKALIPLPMSNVVIEETDEKYKSAFNNSDISSVKWLNFIDGLQLYRILLFLNITYLNILAEKSYKENIEFKLRLTNCWRTTLFFSEKAFFEYVEKYGIPICMKSIQEFPRFPIKINPTRILQYPITAGSFLYGHVSQAL